MIIYKMRKLNELKESYQILIMMVVVLIWSSFFVIIPFRIYPASDIFPILLIVNVWLCGGMFWLMINWIYQYYKKCEKKKNARRN